MVYVHFANGFEEIEAITIVDVLRRAGIKTVSVSVAGEKTVCGAHDISIITDIIFEEADYSGCEMIILPGGMPGSTNLFEHKGLCSEISSFAAEGKYLAAICAAPTVLGKLGLLNGRKATVYPGNEKELKGATIADEKVVIDGNIITSKGPGTAMEFAFALVRLLKSDEEATRLKRSMIG